MMFENASPFLTLISPLYAQCALNTVVSWQHNHAMGRNRTLFKERCQLAITFKSTPVCSRAAHDLTPFGLRFINIVASWQRMRTAKGRGGKPHCQVATPIGAGPMKFRDICSPEHITEARRYGNECRNGAIR